MRSTGWLFLQVRGLCRCCQSPLQVGISDSSHPLSGGSRSERGGRDQLLVEGEAYVTGSVALAARPLRTTHPATRGPTASTSPQRGQ